MARRVQRLSLYNAGRPRPSTVDSQIRSGRDLAGRFRWFVRGDVDLSFLDGAVAFLGERQVRADERRPLVGGRFGVCEAGFEVAAGLVAPLSVTGLAEVLELLVAAVPAVAVLVVLPGLRARDRVATGDAGDLTTAASLARAPHTTGLDPAALVAFRPSLRDLFVDWTGWVGGTTTDE